MAAVKNKGRIRILGASLMGRYMTIQLSETTLEIRKISTFVLIIGMWAAALAGMLPCMLLNNIVVAFIGLLAGGVGGYLLLTRVYPGSKAYKYEYSEISSFIAEPPEFTISLKNTKMLTLRILPRKQQRLLDGIRKGMSRGGVFYLEKVGGYQKVRKYGETPEDDEKM